MPGKAKDYPTTIQRLSIILSRLYMGEALSVKELAEEFGCDPRTVQRYFNSYLKPHLPLAKVGRRWILQHRAAALLDEESELALQTIEEMAKEIGIDFYHKIKPLLSKLHATTFNPFYTKLDMEDISDKFDEVSHLERAIKERRVVQCLYRLEDRTIPIDIRPVRIANFEGFWYLIALDDRNGIVKKYYLKHIDEVKITTKTFDIPQKIEENIKNAINVWFEPRNDPIEVVLYADPVAAKYIRRLPISATQYISGKDDDGSIEFRLKITHPLEIKPFITSWIPHIIVIEPAWLKEEIKEEVQRYLSLLSD